MLDNTNDETISKNVNPYEKDELDFEDIILNDGRFKTVETELDEDMLMYYIDMARHDVDNKAYIDKFRNIEFRKKDKDTGQF